jgi:alkanesulfonate monooxygenase SsuD/methylene tetrahydromethanopterin reductase-like flavin-dependent oxidoreductase (luciferase family)
MEFGVFYQIPCGEDQTPAARYSDVMSQVQLADELGYDMAWLAELHFARRFSVMPAPLLMASALSQTTSNIMLGTAVNLLPLHHPLRIAEEVATLDVLSGGRAVFGIGRGSNPNHYRGYGIPLAERNDRFVEGLDLALRAWTEDQLDYQGQFYQAEGVRIEPKPIQQPYPPVYIASNGADTFPLVGSLGHNILVTPMIVTVEGVGNGLAVYRETLAEHGHDPSNRKVVVNVPVYVGETAETAKADFAPTVNNYLGTLRSMQNNSRGSSRASQLTYEDIYGELGAIGTPQQVIERLESFHELYNVQEFMCWFNIGGILTNEEVARSMQLFADEVMPHFRNGAS